MDARQRVSAIRILCIIFPLWLTGLAAMAGDWDFDGQEQLTKSRIEAFLSRAVSHFYTVRFRGYSQAEIQRTKQFLLHTGAKFIHGAELSWGMSYPDHYYWDQCLAALADFHATPGLQDVMFEGFIAEHIGSNADATLIPDWLWSYMESQGINAVRTPSPNDAGGRHYFHYPNFFDSSWRYIDRWGPGQSVPDITKTETKLYYRYLLKEYIDAGFESIWFGQLGLTGAADGNNDALYDLCQFARDEAAQRGYRHAVILTSHVNGRYHDGQQILDYNCFPSRVRYSDHYPSGLEIDPGGDSTLIAITQNAEDMPVLLEIDNYGCSPPQVPFIGDGGFDEISGYAYKEPWQRQAFLEQYYWEMRTYYNNLCNNRVYLAMPGRRDICLPGCSGELNTNPNVPYPSGYYSPYAEHCGDEDTIAALFAGQVPSSPLASDRVSVDLGDTDVVDRLSRVAVYDGDTVPVTIGGRDCRTPADPESDLYIYFNINDGFAVRASRPNVFVTIDYYDGGQGALLLQYDCADGNTAKIGGQMTMTGTNTWQRSRFHLADAWFGNRLNGSDFRIAGTSGVFYIDTVQVELAPEITLSTARITRILDRGCPAPTDHFTIANTGAGCTEVNYVIAADAAWLSADMSAGTVSGGAQSSPTSLSYSVDGLSLGEYAATVRVEDPGVTNSPQTIAVRVTVRQRGDEDFDGDVDQEDFGLFQACLSGEGITPRDGCALADLDMDGDVDQLDVAIFRGYMSGAGVPADPHCPG
jgi:hypothetical protein